MPTTLCKLVKSACSCHCSNVMKTNYMKPYFRKLFHRCGFLCERAICTPLSSEQLLIFPAECCIFLPAFAVRSFTSLKNVKKNSYSVLCNHWYLRTIAPKCKWLSHHISLSLSHGLYTQHSCDLWWRSWWGSWGTGVVNVRGEYQDEVRVQTSEWNMRYYKQERNAMNRRNVQNKTEFFFGDFVVGSWAEILKKLNSNATNPRKLLLHTIVPLPSQNSYHLDTIREDYAKTLHISRMNTRNLENIITAIL